MVIVGDYFLLQVVISKMVRWMVGAIDCICSGVCDSRGTLTDGGVEVLDEVGF